jgi:hypothetical protein
MDTLLVRNTLRRGMNNMTRYEVWTSLKIVLKSPLINHHFVQTDTDSIWMLKGPRTDQPVTQNSVHLHIRREIHTDARPPSQTSCVVDTVEESRAPTMEGLA